MVKGGGAGTGPEARVLYPDSWTRVTMSAYCIFRYNVSLMDIVASRVDLVSFKKANPMLLTPEQLQMFYIHQV